MKAFKKNTYFFVNIFIILFALFFVAFITINNKTISPSWFTQKYHPWKIEENKDGFSIYGYKHNGHDQVMQFFFNRADDHQTGFDKNSYSINWQLGLPKNTRAEFSNLTETYFYKLVSSFKKNNSIFENVQLANNFSSFCIFIVGFLLVQIILNKIFNKKIENIFFSVILNPVFFLPSEEGWYMPVLSIYFFVLSFLICTKKEFSLKEYLFVFILCFTSGHLIINSMSFHFWLYPIVVGLIFSFYIYQKIGNKIFFLSLGFLISILINFSLIIETLNSLNISPSKLEINKFYNNLASLEYAMIPMGYFIPNVIFFDFFKLTNLNFFPINSILNIGEGHFGFSILIMATYGFLNIKNNQLKIAIILCALYWMGPLQMLLRIIIGGPFLTETSVGGRFGTLIYIIFNSLSIFAYYKIKNTEIILNKSISLKNITLLVITFVIFQFFFLLLEYKIFLFSIIFLISSGCFYLFLNNKNYFFLFVSIIFIPFYNTISKYGKNSIYPNDVANLNKKIFNNNNFNQNDIGVIANSYDGRWYIKSPIHPNTLMLFNIRSLNGFVTPTNKFYLTLYNYQWMTNWPNKNIEDIINPKKKNSSKKIENTEYLLKYSHRHYTFPIPISNNVFSTQTEKFFDLTGVQYIFTNELVNLTNDYQLIKFEDKIKIWKRLKKTEPISLVCEYKLREYNISSIEELLSKNFKLNKEAIVYEPIKIKKCDKHTKIKSYEIKKNNKNFFIVKLTNPSGIIKTNFVWNNFLSAKNKNNKKVKTIMCNGSFTCIIPKKNTREIFLSYTRPEIVKRIDD